MGTAALKKLQQKYSSNIPTLQQGYFKVYLHNNPLIKEKHA